MHRYKCFNSAMATATILTKVATGTTIITLLQVATPSTREIQLISWGFLTDAFQNGTVELLQTDVAATVIAHVASGVQPLDPNAPPSLMTLGTSATGYTGSVEGTITATRSLDSARIIGSGTIPNYSYQWMPDERPIIAVSKFLRIRALMATTVNITCWVTWDE